MNRRPRLRSRSAAVAVVSAVVVGSGAWVVLTSSPHSVYGGFFAGIPFIVHVLFLGALVYFIRELLPRNWKQPRAVWLSSFYVGRVPELVHPVAVRLGVLELRGRGWFAVDRLVEALQSPGRVGLEALGYGYLPRWAEGIFNPTTIVSLQTRDLVVLLNSFIFMGLGIFATKGLGAIARKRSGVRRPSRAAH